MPGLLDQGPAPSAHPRQGPTLSSSCELSSRTKWSEGVGVGTVWGANQNRGVLWDWLEVRLASLLGPTLDAG